MSDRLVLQVRSISKDIAPAIETAEAWLGEKQVSADTTYFAGLAIDETITNCIKYGYDDEKEHLIVIELTLAQGALSVVVIDDGHAFNPLEAPFPDLSLPIEERPIGGLGIYLLRTLADQIRYERCNGTNRLTLIRRI